LRASLDSGQPRSALIVDRMEAVSGKL